MGQKFLADFHVHTQYSDGRLPLNEVIDLYGNANFGAIAITDHIGEEGTLIGRAGAYLGQSLTPISFQHYLSDLAVQTERAWDQYKMIVLGGFELSKNSISNYRSAHILGIGITDFLYADGDVTELIKKIHHQGALAIAAHPVNTRVREKQTYHLWDRKHELENLFDAWEVASGRHLFEEVAKTKLPKIASSDLHHPNQLTSWKTVLSCEKHPQRILEAIKRQELDFTYYKAPYSPFPHPALSKTLQHTMLEAS